MDNWIVGKQQLMACSDLLELLPHCRSLAPKRLRDSYIPIWAVLHYTVTNGRVRYRVPVSRDRALATAGEITGTGGSPHPDGFSVLGTIVDIDSYLCVNSDPIDPEGSPIPTADVPGYEVPALAGMNEPVRLHDTPARRLHRGHDS